MSPPVAPYSGMPAIRDRYAAIFRSLADRRHVLMLVFGFSSGLPFLLVFGTLSAWLREAGVSRTEIGLLSWVALAYSFKFVWAPAVDGLDPPLLARWLGRRRAWMMLAQCGVAAGLIGVAMSDPAVFLPGLIGFALLVALASATQDVAVDGWRINAAPQDGQAMLAAIYQLGYRLALLCSGAGALYIADFVDWRSAYLAMAVLMLVGMAGVLAAPRLAEDTAPSRQRSWRATIGEAIVEPFTDLARRKGSSLILILALIALYRLPDFVAGVMANPLYIDMGFSKSEIASVSKVFGVWVGIAGAFVGGVAAARFSVMPCLVFGGVAAAASNLMFAWLAVRGHDLTLLTLSISLDNFASGFAGSVLIAYMSGLTSPTMAATQYALLSSLYALPGKFVGGASGLLADKVGYPWFFICTALVGAPIALLSLAVWRLERRAARARRLPERSPEPEADAAREGAG
ncbi:AmpG family muropeptide MFS transporter [Camelimonas lactis]|uniref:PAT family beta-lactamase induction signal transducer AmpG n=1 Tax=Camelimonas lactis TaxID=659006 RepID=A0A4R2GX75_9HYPH|nr:MFS transporter [Camelimonas lactis]TCO15799.1 PAT family beta-lactamase induction signal transducer AmpG [Camelimonas lactis]